MGNYYYLHTNLGVGYCNERNKFTSCSDTIKRANKSQPKHLGLGVTGSSLGGSDLESLKSEEPEPDLIPDQRLQCIE